MPSVRSTLWMPSSVGATVLRFSLHRVFQFDGEVVAKVVETEFRVGAVGHVAGVGCAPLLGLHPGLDDADGDAKHLVERAHPLGIASGEVVIDRDEMHAEPGQRIEANRQRGDECLAFTRAHLGNRTAVETGATNNLDVEVAHVHCAQARLACQCVGLWLKVRQDLLHLILGGVFAKTLADELTQLAVTLAQAFVGERSGFFGQRSGRIDDELEFLETLAFADAEETIKQFCHGTNPTSQCLNAA